MWSDALRVVKEYIPHKVCFFVNCLLHRQLDTLLSCQYYLVFVPHKKEFSMSRGCFVSAILDNYSVLHLEQYFIVPFAIIVF